MLSQHMTHLEDLTATSLSVSDQARNLIRCEWNIVQLQVVGLVIRELPSGWILHTLRPQHDLHHLLPCLQYSNAALMWLLDLQVMQSLIVKL